MNNFIFIIIIVLFIGCQSSLKKEKESFPSTEINYSEIQFKKALNLYLFEENDSALSILKDSVTFYNSGHFVCSFLLVDQNMKRHFKTDYFYEDIGCYSVRNILYIPIPCTDSSPIQNLGDHFYYHYLNPENLDSLSVKKLIEIDSIGKIWVPKSLVQVEVCINPKPNFEAIRSSIRTILESYSSILERHAVDYFGTNYMDLSRNQKKNLRKIVPLNFRFDFKETLTLSGEVNNEITEANN